MNLEIEIETFKEVTMQEMQHLREENLNLKIVLAQVNKNLDKALEEIQVFSPNRQKEVVSLQDFKESKND